MNRKRAIYTYITAYKRKLCIIIQISTNEYQRVERKRKCQRNILLLIE